MTFPEINKMKSTRESSNTKKYLPYDIREIIFRINTKQYKKERREWFENTRISVEKKLCLHKKKWSGEILQKTPGALQIWSSINGHPWAYYTSQDGKYVLDWHNDVFKMFKLGRKNGRKNGKVGYY
jgi:hypothetical protein